MYLGSEKMILPIIFFVGVSCFFLYKANKYEQNPHLYDTRNCRDTRANLDMIAYKHKVEQWRKILLWTENGVSK